MSIYNSSVNYFLQLLEFARLHPNFNADHLGDPKYGNRLVIMQESLLQSQRSLWGPDDHNKFWHRWLQSDIILAKRLTDGLKLTINEILVGDPLQDNWIFLTLNFNDTEPITGNKMLHFAQEICKKDWVAKASFVIEKHRVQGIHHHVHMLIDLNIHQRKGKTIELVYKIAGLKKYCSGKQYVDVKCSKDISRAPRDVYENYVLGNKKEEKMIFVCNDRKWRKENNLQDLYEYIKPVL